MNNILKILLGGVLLFIFITSNITTVSQGEELSDYRDDGISVSTKEAGVVRSVPDSRDIWHDASEEGFSYRDRRPVQADRWIN